MKYEAVVFDLFGTLVRIAPYHENKKVLRQMAEVVGAPTDEFVMMWRDTIGLRMTGKLKDYQEAVRYICQELQSPFDSSKVKLSANIRIDMEKNELTPREGAIEVLTRLKAERLKAGLISDCSFAVPALWRETSFSSLIDVAVFSCLEGRMKSDARIFQTAMEKLAVKPDHCVYVADGMGQELANSSKLGIHPVRIRIPEEIDSNPYREDWVGDTITSLFDVLGLFGLSR
jgi:putative hydrolase of the HAD superfamily